MQVARIVGIAILGSALTAAVLVGQEAGVPAGARATIRKAKGLPPEAGPRQPFKATPTAASLPPATLTEPFAIGEALFDPARVPQAVVSLLAQMNVRIASPSAAGTTGAGLTLDAGEVQTLIDLVQADLEGAGDFENLPYTFEDVHRAASALLPSLSLEAMTEAYTRAYAAQPDALVPTVLMGQPIGPEMHLTRAHIWLLLLDGFAGPEATSARWGIADRELPDLPAPVPQWSRPEWKEVLARLPLVPPDRVLVAEATGKEMTARVRPEVTTFVSRVTGRTLFALRKGTLAGQAVTWALPEQSALRQLGDVAPLDASTPVPAAGVARLTFTPRSMPARGVPIKVADDFHLVAAGCRLVSAAYDVPPPLCGLVIGDRRLRGRIEVPWTAPEVLDLEIDNESNVTLDVQGSPLRTGTRRIVSDSIVGSLALYPDGNYRGEVDAEAWGLQTMPAPNCTGTSVKAQRLFVVGTPVTEFGPTHRPSDYKWVAQLKPTGQTMATEPPDGGLLSLEFFPASPPVANVLFGEDPCQSDIPADPSQLGHGAAVFIPLNDAQWTIPHAAYGVAMRRTGVTTYEDHTSASTIAGSSIWYVRIERRVAP